VPSKDAHLNQARHNFAFFQSFDKALYPDWAVTLLFYTALHYVDAFLATKLMIPGSHVERDKCLRMVSQLKPLYYDYCHLKNSSHNARYAPPTAFTTQYINNLEAKHLANIRASIQAVL
jgi:hypothetical protein